MPVIIDDVIQGTPEWFSLCGGNVGASSVDKIITTSGERSKSRNDFMMQLAGERITGKREDGYTSIAMQNGIEREASARLLFEMTTGLEVKQVGIVFKDDTRMCHCSPDGLISDDAGLEIKNPMMKTHVKYLLAGKLPVEYFCQIQMSLYVTERSRWWFMSAYEGIRPLILTVERDEKFIEKLHDEITAFNQELLDMVNKLTIDIAA